MPAEKRGRSLGFDFPQWSFPVGWTVHSVNLQWERCRATAKGERSQLPTWYRARARTAVMQFGSLIPGCSKMLQYEKNNYQFYLLFKNTLWWDSLSSKQPHSSCPQPQRQREKYRGEDTWRKAILHISLIKWGFPSAGKVSATAGSTSPASHSCHNSSTQKLLDFLIYIHNVMHEQSEQWVSLPASTRKSLHKEVR